MNFPIPEGTRDILPDEMRELRQLERRLREVFEAQGYGEVSTPTIEYHEVVDRGGPRGAPTAYRLFDDHGEILALRSDMTVPIARLVQTRFDLTDCPHRICYFGNAFRAIRPQRGQMREFMQVGIELIGLDAPDGTAEVVSVLDAALTAAELSRAVIGIGDADLYRQLLAEVGVEGPQCDLVIDSLASHNLVALEAAIDALDSIDAAHREALMRLPNLRGGPEVLDRAREIGGDAVDRAIRRLSQTYQALVDRGVAERVQLDLGLLRDLDYYTGAILEVYDPALGHVLGGGGRYDRLLGRFGAELPAAGFSLHLERLHLAQAAEERLEREGPR